MLSAAAPSTETPGASTVATRLSRLLSWALLVLVWALLVEVMLESWVQIQLADIYIDAEGRARPQLPEWPKTLKNLLYLTTAALVLAKVLVQRRWREFLTGADIALVVLAGLLAVAGFTGGSPLTLVGEALFVYLRGVIIFYAWRALDPSWRHVRPLLLVLGGYVVLNAAVAVGQMLVGGPAYQWFGWVDMTWAGIYRAQGLFDHPNHLGHVTGLAMLGLLAWFVARPARAPVGRRWWLLFGVFALSLSATQSRESTIGFLLGAALIWLLRRGRGRVVLAAVAVVVALVAAQLALRPENRGELQRRLAGVFSAFSLPSGEEPDDFCVQGNEGCTEERNQIPQREIRVLYAQQGVDLWLARPVFGYGIGQFGGIVAVRHDPQWHLDPRFGPGGFDLHGFGAQTVDSFWLHLLVEAGFAGSVAYLVWLALLGWPLYRRARAPTAERAVGSPFAYWALSALVFAGLIAALSSSLEDPLFPPLLFTILGLAWVDRKRSLVAAGKED